METEIKIIALPLHLELIPEELRYLEYSGYCGGVSPMPPSYSSEGVELVHLWGILGRPSGHASADNTARRVLSGILKAVSEDTVQNWNKERAAEAMVAHITKWDKLRQEEDQEDED